VTLQLAVSIEQMKLAGMTPADRAAVLTSWTDGAADIIASHGDDVLYRGPHKGDTAKVFTVLARAITALSYTPGGLTFAGQHFCADHTICRAADTTGN